MGSNLGLSAHVKRAYADDMLGLFDAGEAVEAVLAHPGWAAVEAVVQREIEELEATLDERLYSRAEYAQKHGRLFGLRAMRAAADAIVGHARSVLEREQAKHEGGDRSPLGV